MIKIDWNLVYTVITAFFSGLITVGIVLWKLSEWKTTLILKIQKNEEDINNLGNSIRKKIATENYYQNVQIEHIARHLEETTSYRHPTMGGFDELPRNKR